MRTPSVAKKKDDNITRLNVLAYSHALLIIDEWLLYSLKETEARVLLEIVESRYKRDSMVFCSRFDITGWPEKLSDALLADVTCDQIVHDATLYYHLRMELIFDEDEVTEEQKKEILRLSKAEKGISREYLIRSGENLKNLHYAMQGMFGWQNRFAHFFSISDEEFNKLTAQRWGGYRDLCGVLFREPHHRQLPCVDGPEYAPRRSYRYYLLPLNKKEGMQTQHSFT